MARTWTYVGFNAAAQQLLKPSILIGHEETIQYDLNGNVLNGTRRELFAPDYTQEEYLRQDAWYDGELILYKYMFTDGRVLEDFVQSEPWSSGPVTFLALRDSVTKEPIAETLWTEEEISSHI